MKFAASSFYFACKSCGEVVKIEVSEGDTGKVDGPPESCYPAYGGEYSDTVCRLCGAPFDLCDDEP